MSRHNRKKFSHWTRQGTPKTGFALLKEAQDAAKRFNQLAGKDNLVEAYYCRKCGKFHLGRAVANEPVG